MVFASWRKLGLAGWLHHVATEYLVIVELFEIWRKHFWHLLAQFSNSHLPKQKRTTGPSEATNRIKQLQTVPKQQAASVQQQGSRYFDVLIWMEHQKALRLTHRCCEPRFWITGDAKVGKRTRQQPDKWWNKMKYDWNKYIISQIILKPKATLLPGEIWAAQPTPSPALVQTSSSDDLKFRPRTTPRPRHRHGYPKVCVLAEAGRVPLGICQIEMEKSCGSCCPCCPLHFTSCVVFVRHRSHRRSLRDYQKRHFHCLLSERFPIHQSSTTTRVGRPPSTQLLKVESRVCCQGARGKQSRSSTIRGCCNFFWISWDWQRWDKELRFHWVVAGMFLFALLLMIINYASLILSSSWTGTIHANTTANIT